MGVAASELTDVYGDLVFARGFLLTREPAAAPHPSWRHTKASGWHLTWDPRTDLVQHHGDGVAITLLGHAIHLETQTADTTVIVEKLHAARSRSRSAFLTELDELAGRYIVMDEAPDGSYLQSDAAALRNAYYHPERRIVASHQNLVAEAAGVLRRSAFGSQTWREKNKSFATPGSETNWEGVKFLNANLELDLDTFRPRRVQLTPPEPMHVDDVASQVLELTRSQLPFLTAQDRPVVSLTAGQDTRTTLAILRPAKNRFHYFTYALRYATRSRMVNLDVETSRRLADEMGLRAHTMLNLEGPLEDQALRAVFRRNSIRASNPNVVARYLTDLPLTGMHIRSSFNEVAVAGYRTRYGDRAVTPELLAEILTYGTGYTPDTLTATAEYMHESGLTSVPGYDPLDLYYWEVRMGSWLGKITAESDIAFDTHILINSRRITRLLLSVPLPDRSAGNVYHRLIEQAWPELYSIPVNGRMKTFPSPG